ncbi:hypothetical protein [Roseobacter sp. HKCCA0434]|uniref:hypothetical protein n=1 Tax=Roseobacter sp. HKCCA0434 TaxID=3079297 RepID=UPI002905EB34|nr:hypothetical protein [Roseobacter sp. HKCCA0434]
MLILGGSLRGIWDDDTLDAIARLPEGREVTATLTPIHRFLAEYDVSFVLRDGAGSELWRETHVDAGGARRAALILCANGEVALATDGLQRDCDGRTHVVRLTGSASCDDLGATFTDATYLGRFDFRATRPSGRTRRWTFLTAADDTACALRP